MPEKIERKQVCMTFHKAVSRIIIESIKHEYPKSHDHNRAWHGEIEVNF